MVHHSLKNPIQQIIKINHCKIKPAERPTDAPAGFLL
jgi:hypothetical protein